MNRSRKQHKEKLHEHNNARRKKLGFEPLPPWKLIKRKRFVEDSAFAKDIEGLLVCINEKMQGDSDGKELVEIRDRLVALQIAVQKLQNPKSSPSFSREDLYSIFDDVEGRVALLNIQANL